MQKHKTNRKPKRRRNNHVLITVLGWIFLVLGVAGLFLPVLQGVLFLLVGVFLLSLTWPRARLMRQRLGRRFPAVRRGLDDAEAWLKKRFRRLLS